MKYLIPALPLLLLAGCASVDFSESVRQANQVTAEFTGGKLELALSATQRDSQRERARELLKQPLTQADAVQLALVNSPALQAMLAENWASAANAQQSGRLPNPALALTRIRSGTDLTLERTLSFGLLDLLQLPQRRQSADRHLAQTRLNLCNQVVAQVTAVRQAWVRAVAAQQSLAYAQQVQDSANASAELARRMQAAGNFSKLMASRQQVYASNALTRLTQARHTQVASRETLVQALGLSDAQALQMQLPPHLPPLPAQPRAAGDVNQAATSARLDIRIAQAALDAAAKDQNPGWSSQLPDTELGFRRDRNGDSHGHGIEVSVRLPVFDSGNLQGDAGTAQLLALSQRLRAATLAANSRLRSSYSAYRSSYDIARHYQDQVMPLHKTIASENLLRYNGMLESVFTLLADAREQIDGVLATIGAGQQFWLDDAVLQAEIIGSPLPPDGMSGGMSGGMSAGDSAP